METEKTCASCGAKLAPDAPQGLCPECLLKVGLDTQDGTHVADGPLPRGTQPGFDPPAPADLAKNFPQLEILELMGQGGMGAVYKARQRGLDRLVALKILPPNISADSAFAERFAREARALARLNHPNIVAVYDFGQAAGLFYFLMEFVDGLNLRQMLQSHKLTQPEALAIVPQICAALQYAHDEGIVHRDIKPENLLLDKKGRVKIADFGLAKLLGAEPQTYRLTQSNQAMGTPHYMAPEQFEKPLEVDHRADIYSLGVVFYEMLTGELPLGHFALPSQKVHVDVRLDEVVLRTLEKEPARRYQHASEVKTQVEDIAGLAANLTPRGRLMFGYEYRSKLTLWGLPLLHVATGTDPATGRKRIAKGIVAIGDVAKGVIALGGVAYGGLACGGVGIGVVSISGLALGLVAGGGAAIALLFAFGGFALAPISLGGAAVGYYACGGSAWGVHAAGSNVQDPVARAFFLPWAQQLTTWWTKIIPFFVFSFLAVSFVPLFMWKRAGRAAARSGGATTGHAPSIAGPSTPVAPRFSRKAILGAAWAPFFFAAALGMFFLVEVRTAEPVQVEATGPAGGAAEKIETQRPSPPTPATAWWQRLLAFTLLPLGAAAPFGTTILGAVALHDIRHSRGRVTGLPLALADALLFPLLIFDALAFWGWYVIVNPVFTHGRGLVMGLTPHLPHAWLTAQVNPIFAQAAAPEAVPPVAFGLIRVFIVFVLPILALFVFNMTVVFFAWRAAKKPVAQAHDSLPPQNS